MIRLTLNISMGMAKWSKPKPNLKKVKEIKKSFAIGDDKAAKLSKSEH